MNCPYCGAYNKDGAKFCKKCGSNMIDTANDESSETLPTYENQKKSKKKCFLLIVIILMVIVVLAAVVYFTVFEGSIDNIPFIGGSDSSDISTSSIETTAEGKAVSFTTEPSTTEVVTQAYANIMVPDVIGLKYSDAYKKLDNLGIKCNTVYQYSDTIAKDFVISQYPAEGKALDNNESMIIYVSTGKESTVTSSNSDLNSNSNSNENDYILSGSDSRYIDKSEVLSLSETTMELALNEIYARHGRIFSTKSIADYFNSKSWYHGTISAENFDESVFNKYEKANRDLIVEVMEDKGYR